MLGRTKRRRRILSILATMILLSISAYIIGQSKGGSPDDNPDEDFPHWTEPDHGEGFLDWDDPDPEISDDSHEVALSKKNFFIIEYRGDVHEPNRWFVKMQRPPSDWPGAVQARVFMMLELRNADVAISFIIWSDPERTFTMMDRQRKRNAIAESGVWELLSRTERLWAENPEPNKAGDAVVVDVYYERGGMTINFLDAMIEMGWAKRQQDTPYDWGSP